MSEYLNAQPPHAPHKEDYLETIVIHRKICNELLSLNTFLMHGAVVAVDGNAYLFTADSGVGKTTHIRKWLKNIEGCFVVNGDKPLIKITDTQAIACGTPWRGKEEMGTKTMVPLKAIVLMERAEKNAINKITLGQAFAFLLAQTYRPDDEAKMRKTLQLMQRLNPLVSFWWFQCNNFADDCFDVAYNALMGDPK